MNPVDKTAPSQTESISLMGGKLVDLLAGLG
jgi:hypothetical protein